ncbi:LysR family transcriptional regulator [Sphingobium sp. HWE2-09]|uniref:LysR family transcriptional regulator n=1 Tax=Sphingobium sp. HWE2-09 TaxID=3108390 RepID=UPI002DCCA886|nr:LysR family transcriptional regulator [Sphingobium sp. HWE2-09]
MTPSAASQLKDIFALRLYSRVARLGSFSAAARESGMSQSQVSRIIADLEVHLGTRLLTRSTRAVALTETGSDFLNRIEPILRALDEAEYSVRESGELRGTLRLSMPTSIGIREVIPRLTAFSNQHAMLHLQLSLDDRRQDLVRDAVDVAIRVGPQGDSSATARLIAMLPRLVLASPTYLAEHGSPETPADLSSHRIVSGPASVTPDAWSFERNGETVSLDLSPIFSTNENEGAVAAAIAGLGITTTTAWACRREVADGSLVALFPNWTMAKIPVFAYFPMGRATRPAGRAFVDYFVSQLTEAS